MDIVKEQSRKYFELSKWTVNFKQTICSAYKHYKLCHFDTLTTNTWLVFGNYAEKKGKIFVMDLAMFVAGR